jgi:hypothetical protein
MLSNPNDEHMKQYVMEGHTSSIRAISSQRSGISLSLIIGMELYQEAGKLFFVNIQVGRKNAGSGDLKARDRPDPRL